MPAGALPGRMTLRGRWALALAALLVAGVAAVIWPRGPRKVAPRAARELIVFHAGSLSVPLRDVSRLFERRHPGVRVIAEAAGSRDCARKITELGRACDVFASADRLVIQGMLMPRFARFSIEFATNEMGIACRPGGRAAELLGSDNWPQGVLRPDVTFGRSDPDSDPCGYRTLMLFQLAERHYGIPGLAERLEAKGGGRFVRPKETDLLALLEAGEIDCAFIYRSVAQQHGLAFVRLPDEVNLSNPALAGLYAGAGVEVAGASPGARVTLRGAPIVYSVTIPANAPHPDLAERYLALLLSEDGRRILDRDGQPPILPARVSHPEALPAGLKRLLAGQEGPI